MKVSVLPYYHSTGQFVSSLPVVVTLTIRIQESQLIKWHNEPRGVVMLILEHLGLHCSV
jgi:hypothetical protein